MARVYLSAFLAVGLVLGQAANEANQPMAESGRLTVSEYLDLVVSGNYESAVQYWTANSRHRSSRFGIEYIDIPLKIDCASPIIRNTEEVLSLGFSNLQISGETKLATEDFLRCAYEPLVGTEKVKYYYYTQLIEGYHWLIFSQDYHARGWPTLQTKYFNIRYSAGRKPYLNQIVLDAADNFIEKTGKTLGLSGDDLKLLEKEKIEYIYCDSDVLVKDITDHLVMGTYDLASDDIISAFFPHYHELTHFLVNFKLRRLHLYSLPVFREGVAVLYGGRWGKAPTAMLTLGAYLHQGKVVTLDSILTLTDFDRNAGSDLAYPVAALFAGYLIDKTNMETFLELYREMSGGFEKIYNLTSGEVKAALVARAGVNNWSEVEAGFDGYVKGWLSQKAGVFPGSITGGEVIFQSGGLTLSRNGDWIGLTATFPAGKAASGNLLFGQDPGVELEASTLFDEQYRHQREFENYRFGIRFDQFEVGLYDYATNHLLAKYIYGMSPSEAYYDKDGNRVTLMFKADAFGGALPSAQDHHILEN